MMRRPLPVFTALASGDLLLGALMLGALTVAAPAFAAPLHLDAAAIQRGSIRLETLAPARFRPRIAAEGIVLDPTAIFRLQSEIAAASAASTAARAKLTLAEDAAKRAALLYRERQNISTARLQAARATLAAAQANDKAAEARYAAILAEASAHWGNAMATALRHDSAPWPMLLEGQVRLVAVGLPPGRELTTAPKQALASSELARPFAIDLIGPVPGMPGGLAGRSFLYTAEAGIAAPVGAVVAVSLPSGPPLEGVRVPEQAVLWRSGHAVVYRATGHGDFAAVPITTGFPLKGGYFVTGALIPGERIVTQGASLLLGATNKARAAAPPDDDD